MASPTKAEIRTLLLTALGEHIGMALGQALEIQDEAKIVEAFDVDSLDIMEVVLTMEEKLGVEVRDDQFARLDTVAGAVELLAELVAAEATRGAA